MKWLQRRFNEHWTGNKPLIHTFVFLLLIPSVFIVLLQRTAGQLYEHSESTVLMVVAILALALYSLVVIATFAGINRKIRVTAGAYGANTSVAFYNLFSVFLVIYTLAQLVDLITTNISSGVVESSNADRNSPSFSQVQKHPHLLFVSGEIGIAATRNLEAYAENRPEIETLVLDSEGGNVFEARGMARVVSEKNWHTHVDGACLSACTLVYVSGVSRTASLSARFGFHSYQFDAEHPTVGISIREQQQLDTDRFLNAGIKQSFINQLYKAQHTDMWLPTQKQLVDAGFVQKIIHKQANEL